MSSLEQFEQIEYEKMMLNDVVNEIKQVIVTEDNFNDSSKITVDLENCFIKQLQEADDPNHKLSIILYKHYQDIETKPLTYKGKIKIRRDVLIKQKAIVNLLKRNENYPNGIKKQTVINCIKNVLYEADPRVIDSYLESVTEQVSFSYNSYIDIKPYILSVEKAQHHSTSSFDITKQKGENNSEEKLK